MTCIKCESSETHGNWYSGPICSNCYRMEQYYKYPEKHKDRLKKNSRSWKSRFSRGKSSAKRRDIEWTLTFDEYSEVVKNNCFYCNLTVREQTGTSLDRKDSDLGYTKENIVSCCGSCNYLKSTNLTVNETFEIIKLLKVLRNKDGSPWEK